MKKFPKSLYPMALKAFRMCAPPILPIKVRRCRITGAGQCTLIYDRKKPVRFEIKLNSLLPPVSLVDCLIHEWAHALSWGSNHPSFEDHGPEWGISYATLYRILEEMPQ